MEGPESDVGRSYLTQSDGTYCYAQWSTVCKATNLIPLAS